jgi:hypothetical protein
MTHRFPFLLALTCLAPASLPAQRRDPTVGDTIWLTRTIAVPNGFTVRAADWDPADPIELLGRPTVTATGDSAEIAYPAVAWRPGHHQVEIPGPLLLGPGGDVDSLRGERLRLDVASVLPAVPIDSYLPPQPRAALVDRHVTTFSPVAILWALALALLLPLHVWWRRRGKPTRVQPVAIAADALEPPLERWADAGEYRAVASVSIARLRAVVADRIASAHPALDTERVLAEIAAVRPQWPLDELADLLRALDDARFGVSPAPDALDLSRSSMDLRDRLLRAAA